MDTSVDNSKSDYYDIQKKQTKWWTLFTICGTKKVALEAYSLEDREQAIFGCVGWMIKTYYRIDFFEKFLLLTLEYY